MGEYDGCRQWGTILGENLGKVSMYGLLRKKKFVAKSCVGIRGQV